MRASRNMEFKQKRTHFSPFEKEIITTLALKEAFVLEKRANDTITIREKREVWEQITDTFNKQNNVMMRNAKQIKKCWENLKAKAKLIAATELTDDQIKSESEIEPTDLDYDSGYHDVNGVHSSLNAISSSSRNFNNHQYEQSEESQLNAISPQSCSSHTDTEHEGKRDLDSAKKRQASSLRQTEGMENEEHVLQIKRLKLKIRHEEELHVTRMKHEREHHQQRMAVLMLQEQWYKNRLLKNLDSKYESDEENDLI